MIDVWDYLLLFSSALLAASLVPAQSEAVLTAYVLQQPQAWLILLGVASVGNVLGALINWWLGGQLLRFHHKKWFPVSPKKMLQAQQLYQRIGYWSLLGSWLPVIGDPLTLVAGVMREPLWRFLILVSAAKVGRYALLIYGIQQLS